MFHGSAAGFLVAGWDGAAPAAGVLVLALALVLVLLPAARRSIATLDLETTDTDGGANAKFRAQQQRRRARTERRASNKPPSSCSRFGPRQGQEGNIVMGMGP